MFDVGFSEILTIMVVALVVIGPERLPRVARAMGQWWGYVQRHINKIKHEVSASIELEELRAAQRKVEADAGDLGRALRDTGSDIEHDARMMQQELDQAAAARSPDDVPPEAPSSPPDRT